MRLMDYVLKENMSVPIKGPHTNLSSTSEV